MFFSMADLTLMAEAFQDAGISGRDRNDGRTFWNNGLSAWQSAPMASSDPVAATHPDIEWGEPDLRILVVQNNTLAALRQYLYTLEQRYPACVFLGALSDDLTHRLAVLEPWPWVGPPADPWLEYR